MDAKAKDAVSAASSGGGGSTLLGALAFAIGEAQAAGDYAKAEKLRQQALDIVARLNPDELKQVKVEVGPTAFDSATEAPEGRQAQLLALQRLQAMAAGNDPESEAEYAKAQAQAAQTERGLRMAALQRLAQRGAGATSGLALAAQQDAAQAATQQASTRDLQVAADARRRALEALQMQGQLGGQLRQGDYQRLRDRAAAQDAINQFNSNSRWRQAQGAWNAQADKAGALSRATNNMADYQQDKGDRTVATYTAGGQAVGSNVDTAAKMLPYLL